MDLHYMSGPKADGDVRNPAIYIGMYISWLDSHPDKVEVVGSSPTIPTVLVAQLVEQWVVVPLVVGSNPI